MKKLLGIAILILTFMGCPEATGRVHAATSVNDFTITRYQIDYTLSRDSEGQSRLKTTETIDALFPARDQNHGIERAIPKEYDGHPTSLHISAVTNGSGNPRPYTTRNSNGNLVLRIGDADTYVHGQQRYVITYTQRDVTRYFANTDSDEFYWDTNGTEWSVPISSLIVNLHLPNMLQKQQTGRQQCYVGAAGSDQSCGMTSTDDGYSLSVANLSPGENVTLAVGFKPHTFAAYEQSLLERLAAIWHMLLIITLPVALLLIVWFIIRYYRKSNRSAEHTTIVPEYFPPQDISIAAAADIYPGARAVFSAQLIDFAVRRYITIYQTREKSFGRRAEYELVIIKDISDLKEEEQELLRDIFPNTAVGSRLALADMRRNSSGVAANLSDNSRKLHKSIKGIYGLRAKNPQQSAWFKHAGLFSLIAAVLTLSPWLLLAAIVAYSSAYLLWPLTDRGLALYHYLEGLKMYIKVVEAERIRMLQGPETAQKVGFQVNTNDPRQLVQLYERVLPYAMLFGLEKAWNNSLGRYYEDLNESPPWLIGNNAMFNAALLSSSIESFSAAAAYSNPSSSSASGSGGSGFSGGGGGGGGGGGW